ncbi:MAG TPA: hypothetical protein VKA59_12725 [Vicinamibacterales bacterium]|nr:hypothetical protein [Vicinamibacterales bacterium]
MTLLRRFGASAGQARGARAVIAALAVLAVQDSLRAHSGPPFPIVTDAVRGPYTISIWTDPDATDNGTPAGQFWIVIASSTKGTRLPAETRATLSVQPSAPPSPSQAIVQSARTEPVRGDVANQFGAVLMDHEGSYAVHIEVTGPMGVASIDAMVEATYDLRPPPYMLVWYLFPFVIAGFLWTRLLLRRRAGLRPSDRVPLP